MPNQDYTIQTLDAIIGEFELIKTIFTNADTNTLDACLNIVKAHKSAINHLNQINDGLE